VTTQSINAFLDLEAAQSVEVDEFVETHQEDLNARVFDLLLSAANRNVTLWEAFGADPLLTIIDYGIGVDIYSRGPYWHAEIGTMYGAALAQAWTEVSGREYTDMLERHSEEIIAAVKRMSPADLRAAAKQGIGNARFNDAKARRSVTIKREVI